MTANVRRLALDFAMVWFIPFQLLVALLVDYEYIISPYHGVSYIAGLMLAFQPTFPVAKIPLWRSLPVSGRDIGRARWWQMVGIPGIGLVSVMGVAMAIDRFVDAMGWARLPHAFHADIVAILGCLSGQFLYPVILTIIGLITATARKRRAPLAMVAMALGVLLLLVLISQGMWSIPLQARIQLFELVSLPIAIALYVTAPRWPMPSLQPFQLSAGGANTTISGAAGRGGWSDLCGLVALRTGTATAAMFLLWGVIIGLMQLRHISPLSLLQFTPGLVIAVATSFNATAMRVLRAVPATSLQLACYLLLLPLAMVALVCALVMLLLAPALLHAAPQLDLVLLLTIVAISALLIPLALRMSQRWIGLVVPLSMVPVIIMSIAWRSMPKSLQDIWFVAAIAVAAVVTGLFWMRAEIARGTRVYHFQPVIAPRWRGSD